MRYEERLTAGKRYAGGHPGKRGRSAMAMILAGGRGTRLEELTEWRVKPAVPFGGSGRIIDYTLSNCLHSGIHRIGVLVQYKSQSLIRHLMSGWNFLNRVPGGFLEIIPAQKRVKEEWYEGTADAVYQNMDFFVLQADDQVLCLRGDSDF